MHILIFWLACFSHWLLCLSVTRVRPLDLVLFQIRGDCIVRSQLSLVLEHRLNFRILVLIFLRLHRIREVHHFVDFVLFVFVEHLAIFIVDDLIRVLGRSFVLVLIGLPSAE